MNSSDVAFFYNGYEPLVRIAVVGTLSYFFLLVTLRLSGARTLAKMNVFDFIITVGLGSAFGRVLTDSKTSLSEGVVAFVLLALLQYVVSELRMRSKLIKRAVDVKAILLYANGTFLEDEMRRSRVCKSDVEGAVREAGCESLDEVAGVVLEAGGQFGVVYKSHARPELIEKLTLRASNASPT